MSGESGVFLALTVSAKLFPSASSPLGATPLNEFCISFSAVALSSSAQKLRRRSILSISTNEHFLSLLHFYRLSFYRASAERTVFLARRSWSLDRSPSVGLLHDDGPSCALKPSRRLAVRAALSSRLLLASTTGWSRLGIWTSAADYAPRVSLSRGKPLGRSLFG